MDAKRRILAVEGGSVNMRTAKDYPRHGQMVKGYRYSKPITFEPQYGWLASGQFPAECILACSASGSVDHAVAYWRDKLGFVAALEPVRHLVERYLKEFGAWDDLATADIEVLADRILWTACGDIAEQGEWLGLVH
jgi:hypothetical protein